MHKHLWLLGLVLVTQAPARQEISVCGTTRETWQEQMHLHRQAAKQRQSGAMGRHRAGVAVQAGSVPAAARDIGEIAVLEDADGVVARRNPFSLVGKTVSFSPAAGATRYRFTTGEASYDPSAATSGSKLDALDDDDTRQVGLPFPFPFFGATYNQVFVNSDGNLTFTAGDNASSERSLGRMTAGPPRISGLFRDLDPSRSATGVRVLSSSSRFVVSWPEVPEYRESGTGPLQTFQVRLYPDGRIELAYGAISTMEAVVGISPGRSQGSSAVVSFVEGSQLEYSSTIAERFGGNDEVDIVVAAQKFYETHEDAYDYLVIFNNQGIPSTEGAIAYEFTVRNNRSGYGDPLRDVGREFGSLRRLQAVMNLGPLDQYPRDPNGRVAFRPDTPITILGHEAGHLFLAFASVRDADNPRARPMLGRDGAHWAFTFNSEASLLEGNRISDNGENASPRFTTTGVVEGYSALDQYLMGLRPRDEVPATFYVADSGLPSSNAPRLGVAFNGRRRDVRIDEIIGIEGRRTPDYTVSQRRFRFAFVLVAPKGVEPPASDLEQVETYRREFEAAYNERYTGGRARAETNLRKALRFSMFPAAGVLEGASAPVSVALDKPAETPLTVLLRTQGLLGTPPSVTIPAGAARATFTVTGLRAGVDEIIGEAAGSRHETAFARVQVVAPSQLRLVVTSGDKQMATAGTALANPVILRVTDANNLPYPGVPVRVTVSPGGTASPAAAITDETGSVALRWTLGAGPAHELAAVVEGAPAAAVTASALTRPTPATSGVVNAASFQPGISPGSFATIFGASLAAGATASGEFPWPGRLANVQVLINGAPASLLFVSDRQINLLVPPNVPEGTAEVVVGTPLGTSPVVRVPVRAVMPGIFFDGATGYGAVVVSGSRQTTLERPAAAGDFIEIYGTGFGPLKPTGTPEVFETSFTPQVFLDATPIPAVFSGSTAQAPGLYQINAQIPAGAPGGEHTLAVVIGGTRSNEVRVRVR